MRTILISLILAGIASAEVPSLINYQGRLTNADGEPLTGTKNFGLKIFDAQTEGNLLYTENVGAIQLAEGGVYSFQFGGKGTSNTQTTETVGTGNGSVLYQKVLSNTPVVDGSVSVSDGTYTWSQASGSSNEDDFSASFSKNLKRITVNYFAGAPNDSRQIEVTYRYQSEGIIGALSSGSGHWLQLSVDGETQATRERVLAVPFALYAGKLAGEKRIKTKNYYGYYFVRENDNLKEEIIRLSGPLNLHPPSSEKIAILPVPSGSSHLQSIYTQTDLWDWSSEKTFIRVEVFSLKSKSSQIDSIFSLTIQEKNIPLNLRLDADKEHLIVIKNFALNNNGTQSLQNIRFNAPIELRYSD
ncbi:hypothetical protein OAL09_08185 [Verrucomicrobia bacterium]|nr:hypothetical protein [Verrucomicrobiota bacterium]